MSNLPSLPTAFLLLPPTQKKRTFLRVENKRSLLLIRQILSYPEPVIGIHNILSSGLRYQKDRILTVIRNVDIATNISCLPFLPAEKQSKKIQMIWKNILFQLSTHTESFLWNLPIYPCVYKKNHYDGPLENKGFC